MIQQSGMFLGETFAMAVLFNFTKNKEPLTSFIIAASTLLVCGLILTSIVTEHYTNKQRRDDTSD